MLVKKSNSQKYSFLLKAFIYFYFTFPSINYSYTIFILPFAIKNM